MDINGILKKSKDLITAAKQASEIIQQVATSQDAKDAISQAKSLAHDTTKKLKNGESVVKVLSTAVTEATEIKKKIATSESVQKAVSDGSSLLKDTKKQIIKK